MLQTQRTQLQRGHAPKISSPTNTGPSWHTRAHEPSARRDRHSHDTTRPRRPCLVSKLNQLRRPALGGTHATLPSTWATGRTPPARSPGRRWRASRSVTFSAGPRSHPPWPPRVRRAVRPGSYAQPPPAPARPLLPAPHRGSPARPAAPRSRRRAVSLHPGQQQREGSHPHSPGHHHGPARAQ